MENERRPDKRWLWWRGAIVGSFLLFLFASPWPWDFPTPFERFHLSVFLVWLLGWPPVTWKRLGLCLLGAIPLAALGIVRLFLWDGLVGSQIRVFPIQEILLCLPWSWSFMVVLGALGSLLFRGMRRVTAGRHRAIYVFATLFLMIYLGTVYFVLIASLLRFKIPVRGACPFPHEDVTFPASDGRILKGWFVPSKDPNPVGYAMVFHCASGNRSQTGRFSRYLYERGFSLLLFDHRGHGESQGHLSTLGPLETRDVAGAIEFLKTKGPIPAGSILCAGESMGAIMSLIAGGLYPEFGPVLAHASYCDLPSAGKDLVGKFLGPFTQPVVGLTWRLAQWITGADYRRDSPIRQIGKISPNPLFLSHGTLDFLIPFPHALRLFETAGEPKTFFAVEDLYHIQGPFGRDGYEEAVLGFIDEAVKKMPLIHTSAVVPGTR